MIIRQKKRWCDQCNQNVFAHGHAHGQIVMPTIGVAILAARAENRMMRAAMIRREIERSAIVSNWLMAGVPGAK